MNAAPIFRDYAQVVLDKRERRGVRGISHERNRFETHLWNAPFAALPLPEIRPRHLRAWVEIMQAKKAKKRAGALLSTDTVKRSFALVSAICGEAIREEIIEMNPCKIVQIFKREDEIGKDDPWTFLTIDEQRAIDACETIPIESRLMIGIAIGTGIRQGEMYHLPIVDIHLDAADPFIRVRFGSKGKPPKNGKPRNVPIFDHVLPALRAWLDMLSAWAPVNPDGLAFPRKNGTVRACGKPFAGDNTFRKYLAHVGITRRVRWHDLRHSCASSLVSGVWGRRWTLEEIRPVMGHSSVSITERYAHIGESIIAAAARETKYFGSLTLPPGYSVGPGASPAHDDLPVIDPVRAAIAAHGPVFPQPEPTNVAKADADFYEMDWPELPVPAVEEAS